MNRTVWHCAVVAILGTELWYGSAQRRFEIHDNSDHKVSFITVTQDVKLEVLDWGGTGPYLVLLTGLGDNAHVFDEFAYQFTDRFHVIGITRRGFGKSSQPAQGYDIETRVRDDIAVLDSLKIKDAIFMGHSVAATELNKLGSDYPERVRKLVYLDGMDLGSGDWTKLPQPPGPPEPTASDLESVQRFWALNARDDGFRRPLAAIMNAVQTDASGKIVDAVTPPEISAKIIEGLQPAKLDRIRAPTLAILNRVTPNSRAPYYSRLDPEQQAEYGRRITALSKWIGGQIDRFKKEVKGSKVIEITDGNHYIFIVYEAMVVREVRKFLLEER
ncbi:MAG TPA: alpha/beta hydrolase [Fimbriimonadaceae bacterium]|nr:alpha/beta hydrolase [Fimbriimonadaceae bacterium]HRJ97688.1 alpha/beta hydrolase [Fimbriimonadaceae bacterium]